MKPWRDHGIHFITEVNHLSEESFIKKISVSFLRQAFPADLKLIVVWLAAAIIVISLPVLNQTPLPVLVTLLTIPIIPGYCLVAALFLKKADLDLSERIALSVGLSLAIVSLICGGLAVAFGEIQPDAVVVSVSLFSGVMILVTHYRRGMLPTEERLSMPFSETGAALREVFFPAGSSSTGRLFSLILILVILIAVTSTLYVIVSPREGERYTEFFILNENKSAAHYPDQIITGQNYALFIGVGNHEYRAMNYTIETWMVRTEFNNRANSTDVIMMDPLRQLSFTLPQNETITIPFTFSMDKTGYNRVVFLLFNESVPGIEVRGSNRINASYRDLYLRVTFREP
jgi:uncharacterized membrane protein